MRERLPIQHQALGTRSPGFRPLQKWIRVGVGQNVVSHEGHPQLGVHQKHVRRRMPGHVVRRVSKGMVAVLQHLDQFKRSGKRAEPVVERVGFLLDLFQDAKLVENP